MSKKKLLFAASEVYPFAKSGGLADVAHSLPVALADEYDVCVVMPLYRFVNRKKFRIRSLDHRFEVSMGGADYPVELFGCKTGGIEYRFVYSPLLCDRDFLYGTPEAGYEDNALRFTLFCRAIVRMLELDDYAVTHLNDWQCALVPLLVRENPAVRTKTVYTIHNLAYQGVFDRSVLDSIGISEHYFTMDGIEFYGQVNLMKAGIAYADRITTVSPTYAEEILTPRFGCGLEGFLQLHRSNLSGILNGIDDAHFSPVTDKSLPQTYDDLKGKKANKTDYLKSVGLKGVNKPLFVFIGRYTWQKGLDLLIPLLEKLGQEECNVAFLGEGEQKYYDALEEAAEEYPNIYLHHGYDEALSRRLYAAADFLIMPSLFEPCGLAQLIAFAYGAVPVVHHVGGLVDTVHRIGEYDKKSPNGFGIAFTQESSEALLEALQYALTLYVDKRRFNALVRHNMSRDFSWHESARSYIALYQAVEG